LGFFPGVEPIAKAEGLQFLQRGASSLCETLVNNSVLLLFFPQNTIESINCEKQEVAATSGHVKTENHTF